ncbi:hypothetical protein ABI59_03730 [Acidobacteria bacterium Mor1]|nr:hypothetical protein ABI59_03730 [Acidobacteria bacterium Mor1]
MLVLGLVLLGAMFLFIRMGVATDHLHHALVKDPERTPPPGNVLVAPADGTILYIRRVEGGIIPEAVKRGVSVPLAEHLRLPDDRALEDGWLIGVYMNSDSVHINRVPLGGTLVDQHIWNGPHMDMSPAESTIMLTQLLPGWVGLKRMIGLPPYDIEDEADFVLKSARETLVFDDERGKQTFVTRIADFYVGKILTWIPVESDVETGQRLGMITWGSQTDVFFEDSTGLEIKASVGDFVYGGETVLATY